MKKPLTELERRKMLQAYKRRENLNYHAENEFFLIKRFGTKPQLKKAEKIIQAHKKEGSLTYAQSTWLYKHGNVPHYKKLITKVKK